MSSAGESQGHSETNLDDKAGPAPQPENQVQRKRNDVSEESNSSKPEAAGELPGLELGHREENESQDYGKTKDQHLTRERWKQTGTSDQWVSVKFHAVLRDGVNFTYDSDKLYVINEEYNTIEQMELVHDVIGVGKTFRGSCELRADKVDNFAYRFYIFNKESQERKDEAINYQGTKSSNNWRKLISPNKTGFKQFDDICMKSERHRFLNKQTEVTELRPKFLLASLCHILKCEYRELTDLEETILYFLTCVQMREIYNSESGKISCKIHHVQTPFKEALENTIENLFKDREPLQYALATALFVDFFDFQLGPRSLDKLCKIVKNNSKLRGTLSIPDQNLRNKIASAVIGLLESACSTEHVDATLWFLPLFYELLPPGTSSPSAVKNTVNLHWVSQHSEAQKELLEMVKTHKMLIKERQEFAFCILNMFSVETGNPQVLKELDLHPKILLNQLLVWQNSYSKLHPVVKGIAEVTKKWLQNGSEKSTSCTSSTEDDIIVCLNLAMCIIKKFTDKADWGRDLQNVVSSLTLLNAFTGFLEPLHQHEEFVTMNNDTYPSLRSAMRDCIDKCMKQACLEEWAKLFDIKLPLQWQGNWEQDLKKLFEKRLHQENAEKLLIHYNLSISVNSVMEDCIFQCIAVRIDQETSSNERLNILDKVSKNKKCGKILSVIVERLLKHMQWDTHEWEFLLTDSCCRDLFVVLNKGNPPYLNKLSAQAKELIKNVQVLMKDLLERIFARSAPTKVILCVLENNDAANICRLFAGEDKKLKFDEALKTIETDIGSLKEKQKHIKGLISLCNLIAGIISVDTLHLKKSLEIDLPKEERPLNLLLDLEGGASNTGIQVFGKIEIASKSSYFKDIWKKKSQYAKENNFKNVMSMSLEDVFENIYKPTLELFTASYEHLRDLSMPLPDLEHELGPLLKKELFAQELQTMSEFFSEDNDHSWIDHTLLQTECYVQLCHVEKTINLIHELRKDLDLNGDFSDLEDLLHMNSKDKTLKDLSDQKKKIGETLKNIPHRVICFLEELLSCARDGFIQWIQSVIKDQTELPVFVDLASISAGEDDMDIAKVCNFRDAVLVSAPVIYDLPRTAGFQNFMDAIKKLEEPINNDLKLAQKLRDSCTHKEWLQTAHEVHGSVAKSSLLQAREINKNGIYIIKKQSTQSTVSLDNCITLRVKESSPGQVEEQFKTYSLPQLRELQNKLVLVTASVEQGKEEITRYVEVLEQILLVGELFLKLRNAGHILFTDWAFTAYCNPEHCVKVHVEFGIAGMTISGKNKLLLELKDICKSLQEYLKKWQDYTEHQRCQYYYLNYFTAKQLETLCYNMPKFQKNEKLEASVLNMLSFIKENITTNDVEDSFKKALQTPIQNPGGTNLVSSDLRNYLVKFPQLIEYVTKAGFCEDVAKASVMYCKQTLSNDDNLEISELDEVAVMDCVYDHQEDDKWIQSWYTKYKEDETNVLQNQMKFQGGGSPNQICSFTMSEEETTKMFENISSSYEKLSILWEAYCKRLSGLVSDKYVALDVVGETLKQLAESETFTVERKLPRYLDKGRPNLITCKDVEMLPLCLSVYIDDKQPLPTYDEILTCTAETTAEEVELIFRRALQSGSRHTKIYCLLNTDKLNYDVSTRLESLFYQMSQSQSDIESKAYNLIMFCDSTAHHSYILTAFDAYKKTLPPCSYEDIQKYLGVKHVLSGFTESILPKQFQQNTKLISSEGAGMGKSLYVKNIVQRSQEILKEQGFTNKTIRLTASKLKLEYIHRQLQKYEENPTDKIPRIFHFDIPPVVSRGLYTFLVQLFVLRCFHSPDGSIWRCKDSHLYLVEFTQRKPRMCDRLKSEISAETEDSFLRMFPTVICLSPRDSLKISKEESCEMSQEVQLMDEKEFHSEACQRTYQYLKRYRQGDLKNFRFTSGKAEDTRKEWLECLLHYNDITIPNPSWGELRNFTHFLNVQLKKCEESVFCAELLQGDLTGFKSFVVKFMITMSKDFSMRSLKSNESNGGERADDDIQDFQVKRRWEQQTHPYIMFNADGASMTFLGFHISNLNAIDVRTTEVIEKNIITRQLFNQLKAQGVPFNVQFEKLSRQEQLDILCRVLGVSFSNMKDPDETYQLTLDNVMKILAIYLRFQCDIPVIIMGETGCGKTRLLEFMCELLRSGKQGQNMILARVHGGTTSAAIYRKVRDAIEIARENEAKGMDTVLFFDEANTTEAVYAIKEVICDKTVNGEEINAPRLKVVAACNPYRKHTQGVIEQLESAGLGYRVHSANTEEKLGQIPMRQLVYRVQPLPPSLTPLVWDFGQLNQDTQKLYITEMVKSFLKKENLPAELEHVFSSVISASQKYMTEQKDECRMVSLRDIERCMKTLIWFYQQRDSLFPLIDKKKPDQVRPTEHVIRSLILALGVCYYASLENRLEYIKRVAKALSMSEDDILQEIQLCQDVFIDNVDYPPSTARNDALKENVFMMIVCMNLRVPLFLVGKPGSSKSLSKTIAADALQGKSSRSALFKGYKQVQLVSFQCSPHSTADGIISTFRQCAQFQKGQNLEEFVSVVVLDEIGLAEDSPKMPLKTLHPLLEDGCIDDDQSEEFKKVGFIGISNWSLDPAKMNRGILVIRTSPGEPELTNTAMGICSNTVQCKKIELIIPKLSQFYQQVLKDQQSEFFGLRDYYSLIKLIMAYAQDCKDVPSNVDLARAVQRNFGGFDSLNTLDLFHNFFPVNDISVDTISLVKENLKISNSDFPSRYLLLLTTNFAALSVLQIGRIIDETNTEIIFGSGFPRDQEYSQVCRTVNKVKTCMETGRPVVLLNIQSLYESLYDALNQCYVRLGGSFYVDLGLGTHRIKCKVHEKFQLIVIEEKTTVYENFPTPLLNRMEKHCLDIRTVLPKRAKQMEAKLKKWVDSLVAVRGKRSTPNIFDIIIGYTDDTCASVLLQCCPDILSEGCDLSEKESTLNEAKEKLIYCATPDSVLRVKENQKEIQDLYFTRQTHTNLMAVLKNRRVVNSTGMNLEVSTFSRLLNQRDVKCINEELKIRKQHSHLFQLNEFQTEQSFDQALREFFHSDFDERKLLLVQSYFEYPHLNQRLLSCTRYCIKKLRGKLERKNIVDVILLTRLPRISGGCGYTALCGDGWECIHLDELIPTQGLPANLKQLCSMTISEIMEKSMVHDQAEDESKDTWQKEEDMLIDPAFLIKQSMQKGIVQLRDKVDNSHRATKRIEILHDLLHNRNKVSDVFLKALEKRIVNVLQIHEKEKDENWVISQAMSDSFVVEGASFRHMLWIKMEDTIASALAQILAVIDGDNNLDHIAVEQPVDKTDLWLTIFQQEDLLKIPVMSKSQEAISVLSTTEIKDKSYKCRFPFSWVLKARFDQLWKYVNDLQGFPTLPKLEHIQKCLDLIHYPWIHEIKKTHPLFTMYAEDLVKMSMPGCPYKLSESFSEILIELAQRLYVDLIGDVCDHVSLLWLNITYEYLRDNHQVFHDLSRLCSDLMKEDKAREATEAIKLLLKKLEPNDSHLKDFASCQEWLKLVKSVSTSVDFVVSEDSLIRQYGRNGNELINEIRMLWDSTQILYLLMDHLLHDETEMEEKLLNIVTKNFIFLWKRLQGKKEPDMENTFKVVTQVLKQCNTNACRVYLEGVTHCEYCQQEFTDPAELQCGHIFCKPCLEEVNATKCIKCQIEVEGPYRSCEPVKRETILKLSKFRRKCNSFFVEFILKCCISENVKMPEGVVNMLLKFVRGNTSKHNVKVCKRTTDLSPFHECMDPSPTVQSLVLKMLLRCGMDQMKPYLQKFIDEAVKSNEKNADEFYFMVVRSTEDQILTSNKESIIMKATESFCVDQHVLDRTDQSVTFEDLYTIAKLRFGITIATDAIGSMLLSEANSDGSLIHKHGLSQAPRQPQTGGHIKGLEEISNLREKNDLLLKLQSFMSKNPWIQKILLQHLHRVHGLKVFQHILQSEALHWILPSEYGEKQKASGLTYEKFCVYGEMHDWISASSPESPSQSITLNIDAANPYLPICLTLAAINHTATDSEVKSYMAKIKENHKDMKWEKLVDICDRMGKDRLSMVSEELSLSHSSSLAQMVLHTVMVAHLSSAPEMCLLKTLCFVPNKAKNSFIPTMPDPFHEIKRLKMPEKIWKCKCGEPVLIGNCGRPWVIATCHSCNRAIGGESHKPVEGFTEFQNTDFELKGHILRDPSSRMPADSERSLSGASLCLSRALIHASLLWGAIDNPQVIKSMVKHSQSDAGKHLCAHLQKDIQLLAAAIEKSPDDAEITVHLFLKHMLECNTDTGSNVHTTETNEERMQWEESLQKKIQDFFSDFDLKLSNVKESILEADFYSKIPAEKNVPNSRLLNLPLMWRFEQRMTIQHLTHSVEQEDGKKRYPVLLELLNKHAHIQYVKHLPHILSLQHRLIQLFHCKELQDLREVSVKDFLQDLEQDDASFYKDSVDTLLKVWNHLKQTAYLPIPAELELKNEENIMLLDLLPRNPSITQLVTKYLVKIQNDCINSAKTLGNRMIEAGEVKQSHVITCTPEQDFLPIAMSNIGYVVNEDGTESTNYNFKILEKQLVNRFISEKPQIKPNTIPSFDFNPVKTLRLFFINVKDRLEPLGTNNINYIMNEFQSVNEISAALSALKIAIGFLELSFGDPEMSLVDYMKNELRMEDRAQHLNRPVLQTSKVKHIQSLWEVLSTRRSVLLIQMNQNPFFMIGEPFQETLCEEEKKDLKSKLASLRNIDLFITELHDVIMHMEARDVHPFWPIKVTFEEFLNGKEMNEQSIEHLLNPLREDLEMKHVIAVWKLAVQRRNS